MTIPTISELDGGINTSELYSGFWNSIPPELLDKINFMLDIGLIILVVWLVYIGALLLIKLISLFFGTKESRKLGRISEQLDEIIGLLKKGKSGKDDKKSKK